MVVLLLWGPVRAVMRMMGYGLENAHVLIPLARPSFIGGVLCSILSADNAPKPPFADPSSSNHRHR